MTDLREFGLRMAALTLALAALGAFGLGAFCLWLGLGPTRHDHTSLTFDFCGVAGGLAGVQLARAAAAVLRRV